LKEIKELQAENLSLSNQLKDASEEIVVKSDEFESKLFNRSITSN
jgi:hypothetical protein